MSVNMSEAANAVSNSILNRHPDTEPSEWNTMGDGWRHRDARIHYASRVGANASIGPGVVCLDPVVIGPNTSIGRDTRIEPFCVIGRGCRIQGRVVIGRGTDMRNQVDVGTGTTIGEFCRLDEGSELEASVVLGHHCRVGAKAIIGVGSVIAPWIKIAETIRIPTEARIDRQPLTFLGSKHNVCRSGTNVVSIGCQVKSLDVWLSTHWEIKQLAELSNYTDADLAEYRTYLEAIRRVIEAENANRGEK